MQDFDKMNEITEETVRAFREFLFIPDVIKTDKQVFFFDIPRLGSQFSAKF